MDKRWQLSCHLHVLFFPKHAWTRFIKCQFTQTKTVSLFSGEKIKYLPKKTSKPIWFPCLYNVSIPYYFLLLTGTLRHATSVQWGKGLHTKFYWPQPASWQKPRPVRASGEWDWTRHFGEQLDYLLWEHRLLWLTETISFFRIKQRPEDPCQAWVFRFHFLNFYAIQTELKVLFGTKGPEVTLGY